MESLDLFRHSWQQELASDEPKSLDDSSHDPIGDLRRIASKSKHLIEYDTSIPPPSQLSHSSNLTTNNASFTIGIRTFIAPNSSSSLNPQSIEPPAKKLKTSTKSSLLDELIRDIDESTDVPFFNVSLPREIALQIFDYLSIQDLCSCLQVCRSWHSLSIDDLLWYNLHKRLKLDDPNGTHSDNWKDHVKDSILSRRKINQNFKNHQCRITKLTNRLGVVLTCANNDETSIVGGYSTGIIRKWSIEAILNSNGNDEDNEQLDTPDTIYESTDTNQFRDMASVKSVGFLKNDVYALHDDGLLEIWPKDTGNKPRYTHQLASLPIKYILNDEDILCAASSAKFSVWNFSEVCMILYRELLTL